MERAQPVQAGRRPVSPAGLSETSRSNLLNVLGSARFRAAAQSSPIWVDYQQVASGEPLPRRVRVHADGTPVKIAITSDRGVWILSGLTA